MKFGTGDVRVMPLRICEFLRNWRMDECPDRRSGHSSILPALNFQPAATREPDSLCGNQRYRRELLVMGIMVPETC